MMKRPRLYQKAIYLFTVFFCRWFFRLVGRLEITGMENVPKRGAAILAANHRSLFDPPLIGAIVPRFIYFFAKEELFRIPFLGWYIRQLNAFPVRRFSHDVGAFKRAQMLLTHGQAVLLFPEGRRSKTGELGKAKAGVGMLAYKANVPVVPIYISNSNEFTRFKKLRVRFGPPIYPPETDQPKDSYQSFSDQVLASIADLKEKMYNKS